MSDIWIWGNHAVKSVLNNKKRKVEEVIVSKNQLQEYENLVDRSKIRVCDSKKMNQMFGQQHQGVAVLVNQLNFFNLDEWLGTQGDESFLIACDLLEDPHNLGAVIRTATAFGVSGILVTKKKSAPFEGSLAKSAAGALELLPIVKVVNLSCALNELKKEGYFVLGLDENGVEKWPNPKKKVLVLGQEGSGLRHLTKKMCDDIISINTKKDFATLNVSVAAAVAISKLV